MDFVKPQKYSSILTTKEQVSSKVYKTIYTLQSPVELSFIAGQTVMLFCGSGVNRSMTIASPPQENKAITIFQDVSPMGLGSQWLLARSVGDTVELMGPLGRFVIDNESSRKKIFVATGTGIAPFRSMLFDQSGNWKLTGDVSLYWGLRHEEDQFLIDECKIFAQENPLLHFYFALSKPTSVWIGLSGHVSDHVFHNETDLINKDFYLCGGKPMIRDMQERLKTAGVPETQIKYDPFF